MGGQDSTIQMSYAFQYINIWNIATYILMFKTVTVNEDLVDLSHSYYFHHRFFFFFTEVINNFTEEKKKARENTVVS